MKKIYIFGQKNDPHISAVTSNLIRHSEYTVKVCNVYLKRDHYLSFSNDDILLDGDSLYSADLVWWRIKPYMSEDGDDVVQFDSETKKEFWYAQWMALYRSVRQNKSIKQLNFSPHRAYDKACQLRYAKAVGFMVPETVISNDTTTILENISSEKILVKPLTSNQYDPNKNIFAHTFSRADILDMKESISLCPSIFQSYCDKEYEVRVFVFGNECHAIRIDSQQKKESRIDWRMNTYDPSMFSAYKLEKEIETLLYAFLETTKLAYGVFDLIRDLEGNIIFLECNPEGQWLFMEIATGVQMTKCFSKYLINQIG